MKLTRLVAFLILGTLTLTACGGETVETEASTQVEETTAETEFVEIPGIPEDLRYDGQTFRILSTAGNYLGVNTADFDVASGNALSFALYDRLMKVEDRFGITFDIQYQNSRDIEGLASQSIKAGSDDYDMVWGVASYVQSSVYEGLYMPIEDLPYIDLERPWWNKDYIESVSINAEKPCILFGSINWNAVERSVCTFFNIDMLQAVHNITEQDMYDMVLAGDWTLDKLTELCHGVYKDENGNTACDEEDTFGFIHTNYVQVDYLAFASGLKFTDRDENGYPVLALNNERSVELVEKLLNLFGDKQAVYNQGDNNKHVNMFGAGQAMFLVNRFFICGWDELRTQDVNYGMIPVPKFDETVDNYYSPVERLAQWGLIPSTVKDPEMVSAVTEYMAYEGYNTVTPAYYETTLKFKYTRGDLDGASKMLDIITENQYTDFLGVNMLGGLESIFKNAVKVGRNNFASSYASLEFFANNTLAKYIAAAE